MNAVNEVTELSDGTTFTYDLNGNRTQKTKGDDTWIYSYDYANRLTEVEKNSTVLEEYVYDGNGKRIQVTENGETTTYIHSGLNILYEENETGTSVYIYGPTGRLAKRTSIGEESHTFYYHADCLGSVRLVTDESKNIVSAATYHPFGESCTEESPDCYLFTGKERDSTDFYYYGARYYDPGHGRFLTRDPLSGSKTTPQSLNRYTYCQNNPICMVDPTGLAGDRFCDDSGVCISKGPNGWMATDAKTGEVITTEQKINELLDEGKILEAVIEVLKALGYDTSNATIMYSLTVYENDPNMYIGSVSLLVDGIEVVINVYTNPTLSRSGGTTSSPQYSIDGANKFINVVLYVHPQISASNLYHVVGHEMVHVKQYTSGKFSEWEKQWGTAMAIFIAEQEAVEWGLIRLEYIDYLNARRDLEDYLIDVIQRKVLGVYL